MAVFTHRPCISLAQFMFWWWRHNFLLMMSQWPDNCDVSTWKLISNSLDMNLIHSNIHGWCGCARKSKMWCPDCFYVQVTTSPWPGLEPSWNIQQTTMVTGKGPRTHSTYRKTSNISRTLVKLLITQMQLEHRLSALLQLHLHSQLNTWLQWIEQRQLLGDTRNIEVLGLGATYTRGFTIHFMSSHSKSFENLCCTYI